MAGTVGEYRLDLLDRFRLIEGAYTKAHYVWERCRMGRDLRAALAAENQFDLVFSTWVGVSGCGAFQRVVLGFYADSNESGSRRELPTAVAEAGEGKPEGGLCGSSRGEAFAVSRRFSRPRRSIRVPVRSLTVGQELAEWASGLPEMSTRRGRGMPASRHHDVKGRARTSVHAAAALLR